MKFYVRATGNNRYAAGTVRWLKIRSLKRSSNGIYEIGVRIKGNDMYTNVSKNNLPSLEFKIGYWPNAAPIPFEAVIKKWESKDLFEKETEK